jgi:hypothetical protein
MKLPWIKSKPVKESNDEPPRYIDDPKFKEIRQQRRKTGGERNYHFDYIHDEYYDLYQELVEPRVYQLSVLDKSVNQGDKRKLKQATDKLIESYVELISKDRKRTVNLLKKLNVSNHIIDRIEDSPRYYEITYGAQENRIRTRAQNTL